METNGNQPKQYYLVSEAAVLLRVTERTIHTWVRQGRLPARAIGGRVLIPVASVDYMPGAEASPEYSAALFGAGGQTHSCSAIA